MNSMAELYETQARRYPDQVAVTCGNRRVTYRDLVERARRLGWSLYGLGVRRRDRVAMLAMNTAEWFDYFVACYLAGFCAETVNFRFAAPEIEWVLRDGAPKVLIFEDQYTDVVDSLRGSLAIEHYVCIGNAPAWARPFEQLVEAGSTEGAPIRGGADDLAHLIYTSGTTGRPKGAARSQRAEAQAAQWIAVTMNMAPGSSILLAMPLFHAGALALGTGQHWAAGNAVLHRNFVPAEILRTIQENRIDSTHLAPTMVQAVLDVPDINDYDLSSLTTVCYAAAPMPVTVLRKGLELLGPIFLNMYGGTEMGTGTVLYKHLHRPDGTDADVRRLASVGQPFPGTEIRILDDAGHELAPGQPGEIVVRSRCLMDGYWNNSVATAEAMPDGWYRTGDIGTMDEQGYVFLVDRKKDMIISGGENVYCREVEEALMEHGSLSDVAVIGVPDEKWGEAVKAVAIRRPGSGVSEEELIAFAGTRIARYKRPKSVDFVNELPRLPSGKVSKVLLRQKYRS
jgi:acyl-CoA synthetase (AMP-forming)/AMP-acid ligase II